MVSQSFMTKTKSSHGGPEGSPVNLQSFREFRFACKVVLFRVCGCLALISFWMCLSANCFSQNKNIAATKNQVHLHVHVMAKAYEDSIIIRWAPENAVAWTLGKDSGYFITRIDYSDAQHPVKTILNPQPFRPMTLDQMKAHLGRDNKYAAIAAQAMYGNDFRMTKEEPVAYAKKMKQAHDAMNFRFSFAMQSADFSPEVASALALRWVDKEVRKDGKYIYLITVNGRNKTYTVDSAATFVTNARQGPAPGPQGLSAYGFDRRIELHWNRRQSGNFSAYYIERSDDGGKTFKALNKLPYYTPDQTPPVKRADSIQHKMASLLRDHQVYFDSIPLDYTSYYYRVRGIDAFASLSPYSQVVMVQGRDLTAPSPPVIDSAKNTIGNTIVISWTQRKADPDIAGYYISRATSVKGPFYPLTKTLLGKTTKNFTDTAAIPHLPNYYVVIAVDTAKNLAASGAFAGYLSDTVAPAAPVALEGKMDSNGIVHLHWAANKEPDLKGYKVYYSYNPGYEFSQITQNAIAANEFSDTISLKSLNRKIYYKVVAVDRSNNHSTYSIPLPVQKKVVVPPSAPVAENIVVQKTKVAMEWIESRSEGATGYQVYRKENGKEWLPLAKLKQDWNQRSLHFEDTSIALNTDYYYTAETIDTAGVRSVRSYAVHVRSNARSKVKVPDNFTAKLNAKQHAVHLDWQYKDTGDYFFVVYRGINNGAMNAWHSFEKNTLAGDDQQIINGTYQYAIKVVYRSRAVESDIGKPVSVDTR